MNITRRTFVQLAAGTSAALACTGITGCAAESGQNAISLKGGTNASSSAIFKEFTGTASNYASTDNWMYYPTSHTYDADVLWFYPTSYSSQAGPTIGTVTDAGMRTAAQSAYKAMGSVFEGTADVYVPYYRQVNGADLAKMDPEEVEASCWEEPRTDLYAALDYYFQNANKGRPFILAGHSQGSMMLDIILREYFKVNNEYLDYLVAAYMLGYSLTKDLLKENSLLKAASGADDTGCIVSWNVEGTGNEACGTTLIVREGAISINPLNWKTDSTRAGAEANKGSWLKDASGTFSLQPGIADATLDMNRGTVVCSTVDPAVYAMPADAASLFGPQSFHAYDYGFYYASIRKNAQTRVEKWLDKR